MDPNRFILTAEQFLNARKASIPPAVIDLRGPELFEAGHLAGARNIPAGYLAEEAIFFPPKRLHLLYADSPEVAQAGAELLAQKGFEALGWLKGSYQDLTNSLTQTGELCLDKEPVERWPDLIEQVLDDRVRPYLEEDGGGLVLFQIEGDKLFVDFTGNCQGCESSRTATLRLVQLSLAVGLNHDLKVIARRTQEAN
ncbi:MAG: hypothetical protein A2508_05410 [Candidatus Lambdaproteobacteria bacterium RIFOXYD12_FULL_49_8]|uniref:Rhodanese domain-containing protein n=1 Tax=Candidatus Lambdaproteobacteria bacterium RIFOXYD2_FULL_50_16 TaxID=1817772 RepID=A0A1F6GEP8_9PROT|nr:MAG: hypothetical protein A2527_03225 [Candidatus Lambdaproteobacteria bacterium RIFOXYD2_FULL_50_16]OGG97786.1 MAG: hypothetical protein A2508_05410 [Candidatus Lambdaproteobacteria bacterium RIFOXYD12_FULL_49_8]